MTSDLLRPKHLQDVTALLRQFPVVALLGARQVGKTTLARQIAAARRGTVTHFDLENAEDRARLADPLLALRPLRGLVIIDEIQHAPEIFRTLRVLADAPPASRRFLILGSASIELLQQSSESLAGRIAYHELPPFSAVEVGHDRLDRLWLRGGFPRSFLARSEAESWRWRDAFVRTYLERDLPQLGLRLPAAMLRKFWTMIAHYHGQTWNGAELGRAFGVAHTTVQRYLDVLTDTFVVRQLPPWFENIAKRQVRSPKVYVRDAGLLHFLLGIRNHQALGAHPKVGASWEGFALEQILADANARRGEAYWWATHGGAELDLLLVRGRTRIGVEFTRTTTPSLTASMRSALETLHLKRLFVVCAVEQAFDLATNVRAIPLREIAAVGKALG